VQASSHQAAPAAAAEPAPADGEKVSLSLPPALGMALMPFQQEGVIFGVQHGGRVLIGDEMGLGKTLQALALAWHFRAEWPLLIVTPSSVRGAWMDEMEKWFPSLSPTDFNMVRSGADIGNFDAKITLITYNLLRQPMLHEKIEARKFKFIILDECHYIKSSKSQRTKKLMPLLQQSQRLLLLSGTPALSRPEELYTQLQALQPGTFGSFSAFAKRYCDAKQTRFGWDTRVRDILILGLRGVLIFASLGGLSAHVEPNSTRTLEKDGFTSRPFVFSPPPPKIASRAPPTWTSSTGVYGT
jgi:SNF2 family DNA or RNA helicase